jgi:hypothetical protein
VKKDIAFFGGKQVLFIQNWGYNGICADWPLAPLGLNAPLQSPHGRMPQHKGSSLFGRQSTSLISDFQTATIAMAPKPLLNAAAIWRTLTVHLFAEGISTAQNDNSSDLTSFKLPDSIDTHDQI